MPRPDARDLVDNLRTINAEISQRSDHLSESSARIDTKATTLLGFVAAGATFLASRPAEEWFRGAAFIAMAVSAAFGIASMRPRTFRVAPEPPVLWQHARSRSEAATLALVIEAKVRAFRQNCATHRDKCKHWNRTLWALTLSVLLTITALVLGAR